MPSGVYKRTPEMNAANSKSKKGVKRSPETCASISAGTLGIPKSPEHCAAISAAQIGVSLSPEHCAAISKGHTGVPLSPEHCAALEHNWENMRGGHDICKHHFIYDHNNPENHTIEITRSEHSAHHQWMKRNGLEVPHMNVTEENKDIFGVKYNVKPSSR